MATLAPEVSAFARDAEFERLYHRHVKDVYHYALALLRNPADAEDVTQTTFMNAYRAFRRGDEIEKPHNWLIKIAHNVARSRYSRMTRRVKEVPLEDHIDHIAAADDERPDVEAVLQALARLPFNQRAALVMRELEGRSYVEISETLDVSVAAVETLIFRARRSLRVRVAALKSIAAIPLPTSLMQVFGGGGAVAGGVGSGFLLKAAVALVTGAVATGISSDRRDNAVAASKDQTAAASSSSPESGAPSQQTLVARAKPRNGAALKAQARPARARHERGAVRPVSSSTSAATTAAVPTHGDTPGAQLPSGVGAPSPVPVMSETVEQVTDTVNQTVEQVTQTVDGVVGGVTAAVPVPVPSVPIEAPNLPKLP